MVENVLFLGGAVEDDVLFLRRQVAEGHVRAHAHLSADVGHQRPHQAVPWGDGAAIDGERVVRDERFKVDRPHGSRAAAALARALGVEGQLLGGRHVKVRAAVGADEFLPGGDGERRRQIVPVRAAVAGKARVHEPQGVQKLRPGAECAADAADARPLVQRERRGDIEHLVHGGARRLRHAAAGVGGQSLEIAARALGVQHAQRERGLARAGNARHADDFVQRNIHVHVFQVVDARTPHENFVNHGVNSSGYR